MFSWHASIVQLWYWRTLCQAGYHEFGTRLIWFWRVMLSKCSVQELALRIILTAIAISSWELRLVAQDAYQDGTPITTRFLVLIYVAPLLTYWTLKIFGTQQKRPLVSWDMNSEIFALRQRYAHDCQKSVAIHNNNSSVFVEACLDYAGVAWKVWQSKALRRMDGRLGETRTLLARWQGSSMRRRRNVM